jgi:2-keto-4-pentenoate hydratase/2-oxohepta-3-ene-1,7-dioic acid hydratase in catechol pathway
MKLASFTLKGDKVPMYGVVHNGRVSVPGANFLAVHASLRDVIEADVPGQLEQACLGAKSYSLDEVNLLPPIPNARRVICAGMNYRKVYPVDVEKPPTPENIMLFSKLEGTLVGHAEELEMPSGEAGLTYDYEGELVCIIGKGGRYIPQQDAMEHVAGFTIMNDGSVRDWQKQSIHAGKNFANSGSCGPWMVTRDSITDVTEIHIKTRLNGETVQSALVREMLFPINELISYISHTIDLKPGDMIATGSPDGSGGSRNPKRYLRDGDRLEIEVSGIGILKNHVCSQRITGFEKQQISA